MRMLVLVVAGWNGVLFLSRLRLLVLDVPAAAATVLLRLM